MDSILLGMVDIMVPIRRSIHSKHIKRKNNKRIPNIHTHSTIIILIRMVLNIRNISNEHSKPGQPHHKPTHKPDAIRNIQPIPLIHDTINNSNHTTNNIFHHISRLSNSSTRNAIRKRTRKNIKQNKTSMGNSTRKRSNNTTNKWRTRSTTKHTHNNSIPILHSTNANSNISIPRTNI